MLKIVLQTLYIILECIIFVQLSGVQILSAMAKNLLETTENYEEHMKNDSVY